MPLLDTDIMIDVLRNYPPALGGLRSVGEESIVLPGFVVMALYQGCQNKSEHAKVGRVLKSCRVVWPSEQVCSEAAAMYSNHHLNSGLGILDALIGQTSIALGLPLHTFNEKHYRVIPGLRTIQPYPKP